MREDSSKANKTLSSYWIQCRQLALFHVRRHRRRALVWFRSAGQCSAMIGWQRSARRWLAKRNQTKPDSGQSSPQMCICAILNRLYLLSMVHEALDGIDLQVFEWLRAYIFECLRSLRSLRSLRFRNSQFSFSNHKCKKPSKSVQPITLK